jgi:hypothetical protein
MSCSGYTLIMCISTTMHIAVESFSFNPKTFSINLQKLLRTRQLSLLPRYRLLFPLTSQTLTSTSTLLNSFIEKQALSLFVNPRKIFVGLCWIYATYTTTGFQTMEQMIGHAGCDSGMSLTAFALSCIDDLVELSRWTIVASCRF